VCCFSFSTSQVDDYDTDGDIQEEEDDELICDEVGGDNNDTALDEDNMRNEDVAFVGNDHDVDFGSDDQLIRGENDEKNNLISQIDVEGTLRTAIRRYKSGNNNAASDADIWYNNLLLEQQEQINVGIYALLYAGCMGAAQRIFDNVGRQCQSDNQCQADNIIGNRAITDLSRTILFKGLSGDVIDKTKCVSEALGDGMENEHVATAVLSEAEKRLRNVFGFAIREVPAKMEDDLPSQFGNRLYLINDVVDDSDGTHSLNIHCSHVKSSVERGVLIMILAFAFCKGTEMVTSGQMKGAGKQTRWITEHHLYGLMHLVDENIPAEPPSAEGRKKSRSSRKSLSPDDADGGVGQTPNIDALLERFVQLDYLLRDKIEEPDGREGSTQSEDGKVTAYAMGPRAAMEVGQRQIIYFCANVLDEEPDPTMLAEVDGDDDELLSDDEQ
jgi:hypothetical protein